MKIYASRNNISELSDTQVLRRFAGKDVWIKLINKFSRKFFVYIKVIYMTEDDITYVWLPSNEQERYIPLWNTVEEYTRDGPIRVKRFISSLLVDMKVVRPVEVMTTEEILGLNISDYDGSYIPELW